MQKSLADDLAVLCSEHFRTNDARCTSNYSPWRLLAKQVQSDACIVNVQPLGFDTAPAPLAIKLHLGHLFAQLLPSRAVVRGARTRGLDYSKGTTLAPLSYVRTGARNMDSGHGSIRSCERKLG